MVYSFSKRDLCQIFEFHQVSIFIFAYKTANFQHAQSAVKLKISLVCLKSLFSFPCLYYIIVCILLFKKNLLSSLLYIRYYRVLLKVYLAGILDEYGRVHLVHVHLLVPHGNAQLGQRVLTPRLSHCPQSFYDRDY